MIAGYFFALETTRRGPLVYFTRRAATIASIYVFGLLLAIPVFLAGNIVRDGTGERTVPSTVGHRLLEFGSPLELLYYGNSASEILWCLPELPFSYGPL